jgi:hypothetical protein
LCCLETSKPTQNGSFIGAVRYYDTPKKASMQALWGRFYSGAKPLAPAYRTTFVTRFPVSGPEALLGSFGEPKLPVILNQIYSGESDLAKN